MSFVLLKDVVCHILQNCCEVSLWGCVCHVCPELGTSILPQQALRSGCPSGVSGTPRCHGWLLWRVAAHCSPLTHVKHPLGQWNMFGGASEPLPGEHEKENFATGVYCGRMRWPADALGSQGGGEQQQCEAARPNLPGTAIWLLKYY